MTGVVEQIYSAKQVAQLDRQTIAAGTPGYELMCRAGAVAFDVLVKRWPDARRVWIFCGAGNNAGDGYVLARLLSERGYECQVAALIDPDQLKNEARDAWLDFVQAGGSVESSWDGLSAADVAVDALLGTGLDRDLTGQFAAAVEAINQHPQPVLSLDIPTGLHADTGAVMGHGVQATVTVSFVGLKIGCFLGQAPACVGDLVFNDLGIPESVKASLDGVAVLLDQQALLACLPARKPTAHKGNFGRLLAVGGGVGMPGAIRLSAEAALYGGAGAVTVATHPSSLSMVLSGRPELMGRAITQGSELQELFGQAQVLILGPGLGRDDWAKDMWQSVTENKSPTVLDADGLRLLATGALPHDQFVCTPHPGEAGELLGISPALVQSDRLKAVMDLVARYGGVWVLKGANSLVAAPHQKPHVCHKGNPGMAVAGMGDVLTGIIGSLLAQGLSTWEAACLGVDIHATAGDQLADAIGQRGLLASEMFPIVRRCLNQI